MSRASGQDDFAEKSVHAGKLSISSTIHTEELSRDTLFLKLVVVLPSPARSAGKMFVPVRSARKGFSLAVVWDRNLTVYLTIGERPKRRAKQPMPQAAIRK